MKVDAVSSVGFMNNYSFGTSIKRDETGVVDYTPSNSSSIMKKVPVIVLLAMNPATLNSAIPMMPETDNPDKIVMLAPEKNANMKSVYVINPIEQAPQQSDDPYGWRRLKLGKILYHAPATGNDKDTYEVVFFTPNAYKKTENGVTEVLLIDKTKQGSKKPVEHPPRVYKLIYHDIGKENDYCSVMTTETLVDENRKAIGSAIREIAVDNATANKILELISDESEFENETSIKFETTKSIGVQKPVIEYIKK